MTTTTKARLSADRAARFLERSIAANALDPATAADAQQLLTAIDAGTVRGLSGAVESLLDTGFRRGALAVAAASTPRETRRAVDGIRAVASLAGALGLGVGGDADPAPVPDPVADPVSAAEPVSAAWGAA